MKIIRVLISILISVLCLYFATRNVEWAELKVILSRAQVAPILAAVLVSLFSFLTRTARWGIILQPFQKISFVSLLRWQIGGLLINNLLPLRMGEFARAYWAGHKSSISKSSVLATILLERILDVGTIGCIAIFILTLLGKGGPLLTPGTLFVFGLTLLLLYFVLKTYFNRLGQIPFKEKLEKVLPEKIKHFLRKFLSGLQVIKDKREIAKLLAISLITWCIDITSIYIMAGSLSIHLSWFGAGFTIVGLVLGVMIPAAPGAAGTYEAGGVIALTLLGTDKTLALSFILLLHAVQYLFVLIIGIPILIAEGFSPKKLLQNNNNQ